MKNLFTDELMAGMQQELKKQASGETPNLVKAGECLHAALEILDEAGLSVQADGILQILKKIAQNRKYKPTHKLPSAAELAQAGFSKEDLIESHRGNPIAQAKFNIILRRLGYSDSELSNLLGSSFMSEQDAHHIVDPNRNFGKIWQWIKGPEDKGVEDQLEFGQKPEFTAIAKGPKDWHTKNLSSEKQVKNILDHGTQFNMADDNLVDVEQPEDWGEQYLKYLDKNPTFKPTNEKPELDPDLFGPEGSFDLSLSDDELMNVEIEEDSLEVFDKEIPLEDFEDEKH